MPKFSLQNDFCPPMASAQGGLFFLAPTESRILSQLQHGVAIESNYQIVKYFCFSTVCYFNLFIVGRFCILFLEHTFYLSILGSLCMPKIISTILKKFFWIIKGETTLVCLPVKPLHVLVLSLALTSLFVHRLIFVLIFRKEQPNLPFCKLFFFWFYFTTVITAIVEFLNFDVSTLLHVLRITVWRILKRSTFVTIIFIVFF